MSRDDRIHERPANDHPSDLSDDGVDLTLIRWMLSLTPEERLAVLQQHVDSVTRLRNAQTRG